jgi:hypothetical protein
MRRVEQVARMGEKKIQVVKHEEKRKFGSFRCGWEDIVKTELKELCSMELIHYDSP